MANNKLHGLYKTSVYKLIHVWQPTNTVTQRNWQSAPVQARCKECGCNDKQLYYMECRSEYYCEARRFAWRKFKNKMANHKCPPMMLDSVWYGIQRWIYDEDDDSLPRDVGVTNTRYEILCKAVQQQNSIGWKHFCLGRVAVAWSEFYSTGLQDD